jgi:hypothetical protein
MFDCMMHSSVVSWWNLGYNERELEVLRDVMEYNKISCDSC